MPSIVEHCKFTETRYGVTGESIHKWMDEPVKIQGPTHRKFRHDPNQKIPQFLIEEFGFTLARDIVIDHILQDTETPDGQELIVDIPQMKLFERIQELEKENDLLKISLDELRQTKKIEFDDPRIERAIKVIPLLPREEESFDDWYNRLADSQKVT